MHIIHLKINSLRPKIDELSNITKCSNAAVIGIIEAKLHNTVSVTINRYNTVRND